MQTTVQTPVSSLQSSLDFYDRLKFKNISTDEKTLVTDGGVIIEVNPDRFARAGLKLYQTSWTAEVSALEKLTTIHKTDDGFLLSDSSGVWIYLMEGEHEKSVDLPDANSSTLGNFAGMSLETTDIKKSIAIYEILGFSKTMGGLEQGWIAFANNSKFTVSLMQPFSCPHLFFNPSLSYFNGKNNLKIIEQIRAAQIPITEEITHFNKEGIVDNIIIRDPGGLGFFIYSD